MNSRTSLLAATVLAGILAALLPARGGSNELTEAEKASGWTLLFDGRSTSGWRSFKKTTFPASGWVVRDGCLTHLARGGGGDIITDRTFGDFELVWEWRMPPGANSGVKYFITEERGSAIGHEYQLETRQDLEAPVKPTTQTTAGFYDVLPATTTVQLRPAGQFNESRILVRDARVEHWLNGHLTIAYTPGSDAVKAAVAKSKFRDVPGFGQKLKGHILLQDHGGEVEFRNIKLREF